MTSSIAEKADDVLYYKRLRAEANLELLSFNDAQRQHFRYSKPLKKEQLNSQFALQKQFDEYRKSLKKGE